MPFGADRHSTCTSAHVRDLAILGDLGYTLGSSPGSVHGWSPELKIEGPELVQFFSFFVAGNPGAWNIVEQRSNKAWQGPHNPAVKSTPIGVGGYFFV